MKKFGLLRELIIYSLILVSAITTGYVIKFAYTFYNKPKTFIQKNTDIHFANTDKNVIIYTTKWCPYCKKLRNYLEENHIDYEDRDIESNNLEINRLYKSINKNTIPIIVLKEKILIGFDEEQLNYFYKNIAAEVNTINQKKGI